MQAFPPLRQRGVILHSGALALTLAVGLFSFWQVFQSPVGAGTAVLLVFFLLAAVLAPLLAYRLYALTRANYFLDRNVLRFVWGLRVEEIPVTDVEWVRPVQGLVAPLSLPLFRLPGGILGVLRQPDIGDVEFMAAETDTLLLVATARRIFAISPANPAAFSAAFQKVIEMGSLVSAEAHSEYPSFVVVLAWQNLLARYLWLAGALLNLGILAWVSILIPSLQKISLGFTPAGLPLAPVPGAQLALLPLLSLSLFLVGWLLGLFFYRIEYQRPLALLVWLGGAFSSLLFLVAVFFILTTPV